MLSIITNCCLVTCSIITVKIKIIAFACEHFCPATSFILLDIQIWFKLPIFNFIDFFLFFLFFVLKFEFYWCQCFEGDTSRDSKAPFRCAQGH